MTDAHSTMVDAIRVVIEGRSLSEEQAMGAMETIMTGGATDAQIASLITALRMKGESDGEITGFARVMRKHVTKVTPKSTGLLDTCGTGGDASGTFNISTATALVAAAAGAKVAKHGNRSVSSRCGSADVLEALGVRIDLTPEQVAHCVDEVGVGFMFAPLFHGAMKYAVAPRRDIGVRTIFNILGPLTNPASAEFQLVGVYDEELTAPVARVLGVLGCKRAMVVHGGGGLDEVSTIGGCLVSHLEDGKVSTQKYISADFGVASATLEDLRGGDAAENASIIRAVLEGSLTGPKADIVMVNAGAALYVAGLAPDLTSAPAIARAAVTDGRALRTLERLAEVTASFPASS